MQAVRGELEVADAKSPARAAPSTYDFATGPVRGRGDMLVT